MDVVLFIVGVFILWKGNIKLSQKTEAWPKSKKVGRIIGAILLIPLLISFILILTASK